MKQAFGSFTEGVPCCGSTEEALNQYVDGELSFEAQPGLFAHLAACSECRRTLEAVMRFRRMSRQEGLSVPPGVDEAFFARLAAHKQAGRPVDRAADRRPLWQARAPISLRSAVMVAVLVFVTGLLMPKHGGETTPRLSAGAAYVEGIDERVEFLEPVVLRPEAVYVFYPGLTVEADKEERVATEAL